MSSRKKTFFCQLIQSFSAFPPFLTSKTFFHMSLHPIFTDPEEDKGILTHSHVQFTRHVSELRAGIQDFTSCCATDSHEVFNFISWMCDLPPLSLFSFTWQPESVQFIKKRPFKDFCLTSQPLSVSFGQITTEEKHSHGSLNDVSEPCELQLREDTHNPFCLPPSSQFVGGWEEWKRGVSLARQFPW